MSETPGRLVENIVHFGRALRKAGVKVGPAQLQNAVEAVAVAGFTRKIDFFHTLRATLITRSADLVVFEQVFAMFWRDPEYLERMIHLMSPVLQGQDEPRKPKAAERRATEALTDGPELPEAEQSREEIQIDARFSWSATRVDVTKDFEQMGREELAEAARAIQKLEFRVPPIRTRRMTPSPKGRRIDGGRTLRKTMRRGGEVAKLERLAQETRKPDVVAICDISGSMVVYARMLLHFLHTLAISPDRPVGAVRAFTFGTRLTNITRPLTRRDPDIALAEVGKTARDWEGGTLIGSALEEFNRDWSRRVLGRGALVLLITDGLERGDMAKLHTSAERLSLSCHRLIWLNPLLRWDGFQPLARGIQVLLPHVDDFLTCHSLASISDLSDVLSSPNPYRRARLRAAMSEQA